MKNNATYFRHRTVEIIIVLFIFSLTFIGVSTAAETPQYGGILIHTVGGELPSYDAHQEMTVSMVHPTRAHYSLLLKFDPENYPKIVGDLAESWTISNDKKTYTFKIRKGVKFHDGSFMTARDIKASYEHIIFPPTGVISPRKALYTVVEKIETPDDYTVIFRLKSHSNAFFSGLASPFNYIYKADILNKDPQWYRSNIMGTGAFKFVEHVPGSHWVGKRNEDYFIKGRPYLDGYRALFISADSARLAAIRSGRAHIDFRYFSTSAVDDIVKAMGDKIVVQQSPLLVAQCVVPNTQKKPFDDPRVRKALTLAIDRWEAMKTLPQISHLGYVGGLLRPGSEFAMSESELTKIAGFSKDIEASRKEARRLLREAGIPEGFSFTLHNRDESSGFMPAGIYAIDQWRQIGLNVTMKVQKYGPHFLSLKKGEHQVGIMSMADFMDEPSLQFVTSLSVDKSPKNYSLHNDPVLDDLYLKQDQAADEQTRKMYTDQYQKRVLEDMAYTFPVLWNERKTIHSSKVKGYKALPAHYLNVDLTNVWLSKD